MTKTAIRQFIVQEKFDEEAELEILRALEKYPHEELSVEEVQDLMGAIDRLNQDLDNDLAALDEENQLLNEARIEIDQIEDEAAGQITAVYREGIDKVTQMAKEVQGQLQQQ